MAEHSVTQAIFELLEGSGRPFERLDHPPVRTSEHAAELRGTPLSIGGKSLLFKVGKKPDFRLFVLKASQRTENRPMRKFFGVQKLRFARPEELLAHTGLTPGCVPPFGRPVFDLPVYVDAELAAGDEIAFTAADHRISVRMAMADFLEIAQPDGIFAFARD